ncbi:MAG TPA: PEP-CTERM sorting domain-containing protein, partial [Isosphaeraceae bacterium]|nr:PEP-CTERM sorting domain-containing protein [Isosphaeraceae bacterium]
SNSTFTGDATPNTTSWTIAIYTSSAGEPLITTLPLSGQPFTQVGSAFTGSATQTGSLVSNGHTYYSESAVLNDPITLQAGVTYYLKIFSNGDPSTGSWGWASDGNGYSYQYSSSTDLTTSVNDQNRTFALYGTPVVPEPSGLALSAIGGAGLLGGWLTRRRRRSAA